MPERDRAIAREYSAPRWLRMRAHAEAFARMPLAYIQAVIWRARGLRLRARHRFAALMGEVPSAYPLWIATREIALHVLLKTGSPAKLPPILFIVDAREGTIGLDATLASIARARASHPVPDGGENAVFVLCPRNLAPTSAEWHSAARIRDLDALTQLMHRRSESALRQGSRLFVLTVRPGDLLAPLALAAYAISIASSPDATLFYADDDLIDSAGYRSSPHFKPGWNPELALHHDYLTYSCIFVADSQRVDSEWPLVRPAQLKSPPCRVPYVLHHRRDRPDPVIPPSPKKHRPPLLPTGKQVHVSVVIPTRNQLTLLRTCLEGLKRTRYPAFDVTVIDNGSDEPETVAFLNELTACGIQVLRDAGPFNYSALHNRALGSLRGPLLCLLNNDIEIIDEDWLAILAAHALRAEVGAVGARLLYPDQTLQHGGIVTGVGGGAAHAHRGEAKDVPGYFARARLPQFVSAVTAACLVVEKKKFEAVGGFDEVAFPIAFNDVDLCLKLNAKGFQSFYEPRAILVHHESKSRGTDRRGEGRRRLAGELAMLKQRWHTDREVDPFHHPELSPFSERFVVRL